MFAFEPWRGEARLNRHLPPSAIGCISPSPSPKSASHRSPSPRNTPALQHRTAHSRDDSSPASSWRVFSSLPSPGPTYHLLHHTPDLQDPSNSLTPRRRAGHGEQGADQHRGSSSPGNVSSAPALREGERLPSPRFTQSSVAPHHHHPARRRDRPQADRTGGGRSSAGRASLPPPPCSFSQCFPWPEIQTFPRMQKERPTGQGEEGVHQPKQSLGWEGVPQLAILLLGYVISSPAPSFPLGTNQDLSP